MIKSLFARQSENSLRQSPAATTLTRPVLAAGGSEAESLSRPRLVSSAEESLSPAPQDKINSAPRHVAIIMDGNGRWARQRGLPRREGHRRGVESVRATLKAAGEAGVEYLTLFSFSSENWRRSPDEISDLMGLLRLYLRSEISELNRRGIRLRVIGNRAKLPADIVELIQKGERETAGNFDRNLVLALSYGAREEILAAARSLATRIAAGEITAEKASESDFAAGLYTHDIPDPDLVIRTSGEQRLSNFLLFQSAYSELVFVDCLWPDFGEAEFTNAIQEFTQRDRRFGR
ncbi:MAG: polyprenyl diphosphate synthase [Candidatus Pacebacteria bacterium]|nr:polyprenyl diphosphate synthase [Candidatus Paceibacterota bacterium]